MTQGSDLKKLVRARMSRTGENYTTALAALTAQPPAPHRHGETPVPDGAGPAEQVRRAVDAEPATAREQAAATESTSDTAHVTGAAQSPGTERGTAAERVTDAEREQLRLVQRWFSDGRLRDIPARNKVRAAVLLEVLRRFEPGRVYPERDVSDLLRQVHPDFASLRRELIMQGYLTRADGLYRVVDAAPSRTPAERAELPAWEAEWLPDFLAGRRR